MNMMDWEGDEIRDTGIMGDTVWQEKQGGQQEDDG